MTLAIVLGACGGSVEKAAGSEEAEPVVLTFASNNGGLPSQIRVYLDEVERRAGGTLRLDYVGDWRQGEPDQEIGLIADVQDGQVDMAWVGARAFDSVGVTSLRALVAPFLVDSYELQDEVFAAGIPARMLEGLDELDLTGIGVLPGPLRQMMGVGHAFTGPSDFEGTVVGNSGGDLAERTLRTLGATPQMVPAETSLDGLDGLEYQLSAIYGNRYYERATHVTANLNLWPRPLVIFIDSDRYGDLTDEQQAILRGAAEASIAPASEATRVDEAEGGAGLCSVDIAVVEATDADRAALLEVVAPVYDELEEDSVTRAFLEQIRAVEEETNAATRIAHLPGRRERVGGDADADRRRVARDHNGRGAGRRRRSGPTLGELWDVHLRLRPWSRSRSQPGSRTTRVSGPMGRTPSMVTDVEWSVLDGGGISPNNAANKPGERFVFEWSRYRDTLTLTAVPGEISPTQLHGRAVATH